MLSLVTRCLTHLDWRAFAAAHATSHILVLFWSKTGGEFGQRRRMLREAAEAEAAAAAIEQEDWELVTCDAAGLPFGMVGELRRKLSPIVLLVLLL